MAIKVIGVIIAVVGMSLVSAVPVEYPDGTVVKTVAATSGYKQKNLDYQNDDHAEYSFSYAVHDEHTGDIKSHQESRKGDVVQGRYELIDSDGHRRIVEYTADDHNGFNAVVHREPTDIRIPQPQVPHTQKNIITSLPRQLAAPLAKIATPVLAHHGLVQNY